MIPFMRYQRTMKNFENNGELVMQNAYSVRQINSYIKMMFSQDFVLNKISVKGEVSNCKYHTSGHIYFTLKEESSALSCVMFAGDRRGLSFQLQNGQQVIVSGNVDVYERDGTYQLYARKIVSDGIGALYEKFEALKQELEEMGMFAPEYKQPIPFFVRKLGIVTAPTGAAVRDMIQVAKRRNPYIEIYLYPAQVQGEGAKESIVRGIECLDQCDMDVIIIGRGGGSLEDLYAFNEKIVAEAIFQCKTPVISAVGHETDVTISDFAADLRAPTPSAAAELAVAEFSEIVSSLKQYKNQLSEAMRQKLEQCRMKRDQSEVRLAYLNPKRQVKDQRMQLMEKEEKLQKAMSDKMKEKRQMLSLYIEKMKGLSPLEKLNQGYAFVQNKAGDRVTHIDQVHEGEFIKVYMSDGYIVAKVMDQMCEPPLVIKDFKKNLSRATAAEMVSGGKNEGTDIRTDI